MPFPSGWRTAGRQPELRKNKDLLLEPGKGVGSSTGPRQPPAEPRCAGRRREVRLRWRPPALSPRAGARGGAPQGLEPHGGCLSFPWSVFPSRGNQLRPDPACSRRSCSRGKLPRAPSRVPQLTRNSITHTLSSSQTQGRGCGAQPCKERHHQQRPTPPPKQLHPAHTLPGMGTGPRLCCIPKQSHRAVRTPSCAPGAAELSSPPRSPVTTRRHLSHSRPAVHKGLGRLRQPRGGLSPPFQQLWLPWECLGRRPLCFWEASNLHVAGLPNTPSPPTIERVLARHSGCGKGIPARAGGGSSLRYTPL